MKKQVVLFLLVFCFASFSFCADEYVLIRSIPFRNVFFTTDNLGNAYVVAANQLLQFDPQGKPKATYSENNLGLLNSVDASNPLKILLYYPDFTQIHVLNSKLALQSTINLRSIGFIQPTLICNSSNEGYWVFDLQDAQLKKIDLNLQVKSESGSINQLLGYTILPDYIIESGNYIYLNDPASGILVFDLYGAYYKTIPVKNLHHFQVIGDELVYPEQSKLISFHMNRLESKEILLPLRDSLFNARIEQKELYLLTSEFLNFYSF